jgi:hypothetical protein
MDENNTYINKSEKEALEIMENVSDITSDQLQGRLVRLHEVDHNSHAQTSQCRINHVG